VPANAEGLQSPAASRLMPRDLVDPVEPDPPFAGGSPELWLAI